MTSPASPMLEKLARAIAGHFGPEFDNLPKDRKEAREWRRDPTLAPGAENTQQVMLDAADAALQALKDLDEGTVEAMSAVPGMKEVDAMIGFCAARNSSHVLGWKGRGEEPPLVQAWKAGLDHILKGGE